MMESSDDVATGDLVLCVPMGWDTYISREFHEIHRNLVALGWKLMVVGAVEEEQLLESIHRARVVLLWECYELLERHAEPFAALPHGVRRIVFCDDVHYFSAHRRAQRQRAFDWADLILATYPEKLVDWFPETKRNIKWVPHAAASYFTPIFAPASDRILLSGSRAWPYPFRQFCAAKLSPEVCHVVDHPGYPGYPGDKANQMRADTKALAAVGGERYASLLRRHPAMLVCGSIFNYLVAKVFEGMAAGCLIVADRSSLGLRLAALGFHENEHYLGTDIFHAMEDCAAVQRSFSSSDKCWSVITERAAQKVAAHHTTAIRASEIHTLCVDEVRN
ncbi:glycosyltransferase [Trinickia dinghuensis]|uniref:glycosyltransferase family protein n=1 Tax=Trinickia dinghuensis TaxID=2291023 RepID=UPI001FEBD900|nr:glycosyltransferase [Trinickia dinghuensis]